MVSGKTSTVAQAHVFDAGGGGLSNGTYTAFCAIGQGIPASTLAASNHFGYSGFLNNFVFNPDLDNDGDTVADENDPDDDNDGLTDLTELNGVGIPPVATNPFLADSDSDGFADSNEVAAGTNPLDPYSLLLLSLHASPGQLDFTWDARAGKQYRLICGYSLAELLSAPQTVDTISTNGGAPPWFEVPIQIFYSPTTNQAFYAIEIVP